MLKFNQFDGDAKVHTDLEKEIEKSLENDVYINFISPMDWVMLNMRKGLDFSKILSSQTRMDEKFIMTGICAYDIRPIPERIK